jgi:hypothetical protein
MLAAEDYYAGAVKLRKAGKVRRYMEVILTLDR